MGHFEDPCVFQLSNIRTGEDEERRREGGDGRRREDEERRQELSSSIIIISMMIIIIPTSSSSSPSLAGDEKTTKEDEEKEKEGAELDMTIQGLLLTHCSSIYRLVASPSLFSSHRILIIFILFSNKYFSSFLTCYPISACCFKDKFSTPYICKAN